MYPDSLQWFELRRKLYPVLKNRRCSDFPEFKFCAIVNDAACGMTGSGTTDENNGNW